MPGWLDMVKMPEVSQKKGVALFLVLALVFVTFLLFFFLSLTTSQYNFTAFNNLETELATQCGRAFADVFWVFSDEVFQNRRGCQKIYPNDVAASPLYPFRKDRLEKLKISIEDFDKAGEIKKAFSQIEKEIPELEKTNLILHFKVRKFSDNFVHGDLCLNISFTLRKDQYSFDYFREFKLIRALAPVVPKFSLFLRKNSGGATYNRISKGFQDASGDEKAFFVYNNERTFVKGAVNTWEKSGWIYLGGPQVTLNLDGSHPCRPESDAFMFWPGLYSDSLSQALPYSCSSYIGASRLRVRFTPIGAMLDWQNDSVLKSVLGGVVLPTVLKSSVLRLFGKRDCITPTKVFGKVSCGYVLYSTLILDGNNDSVADNIVSPQGTEQRAIFPLMRLSTAELFRPPIFPRFVTTKGFDLFLDGTGLTGIPAQIEDVFPTYNGGNSDYVTYMTKLSRDFTPASGIDAYNSLYDQIFAGAMENDSKSFPAPRLFANNEYPNEAVNVRLPLDFSRPELQFNGDLNKFDPGAFFADRNIYGREYSSAREFFSEGRLLKKDATLLIRDPMVAKVTGSLTFSESVQADAPAVIVCDGDLQIGNFLPSGNDAKVTLVSLNGNIKVKGSRLHGVSLIAPRGQIIWEAPVEITGSLCAENIEPTTFANGGSLIWDKGMDITNIEAAAKSVVFLVGPNITLTRKKY